MKRFLVLVFVLVAGVALASCAPNPVDVAQGDAMRAQAYQDAQDQEQKRAQDQIRFALEQRQREAQSAQWVRTWTNYVTVCMWFATFASCVAILSTTAAYSVAAVGTGKAIAQAVTVRANLISMDAKTRSYPVYLHHVGEGKFTLTDINTGQVKRLDIRDKGHRALIAGSNAKLLAGTVAYETAKSATNPASIMLAVNSATDQAQRVLGVFDAEVSNRMDNRIEVRND